MSFVVSRSKLQHIPMIPFGLKETKPIDFTDAFKVSRYKMLFLLNMLREISLAVTA